MTPESLDIDELRRILPHRYPMLLVDRVTAVTPGDGLTAVKAVTVNEPWYAGLPPTAHGDALAYPPVLLVESWCQAAGILACLERDRSVADSDVVMLFGSIGDLRLHRAVRPGDVLEHRVRLVKSLADAAILAGETVAGDELVLEVARIVIALRPAGELRRPAAAPA